MTQTTVVVTGAGGPLGVNFTRSLRYGDPDNRIRVIGTDANRWHLPLSLCDQTYFIPMAKEGEAYQRALVAIAENEGASVVIPTHPVEVNAVVQLRDQNLLGGMRTALPAAATLRVTDDKAKTQSALQGAGLPVPRTLLLNNEHDLKLAFQTLSGQGPVWVRGSGAPGLGIGGAALPCKKIDVARAWIEHHEGWGRMAASEYLPGRNRTWMALFQEGALVAHASRERLEYVLPHVSPSGITGAPAVSRTIDDPSLSALGERSVRAVDAAPHGVFFVDTKGDSDDRDHVTEINGGRCGTTIHFYTEAGINFPMMLVRLALGEDLLAKGSGQGHGVAAPGQYWVRTLDCGPVLVNEESEFDGFPKAGW